MQKMFEFLKAKAMDM